MIHPVSQSLLKCLDAVPCDDEWRTTREMSELLGWSSADRASQLSQLQFQGHLQRHWETTPAGGYRWRRPHKE